VRQSVLAGLLALVVVGCSDSTGRDGGAGKKFAPTRVSQHKPSECPTGVTGEYAHPGDASVRFSIRENGFDLELIGTKGDSILINGMPRGLANGESWTAICSGGTIDLQTVSENGIIDLESMSKSVGGVLVQTYDDNGQSTEILFVRMGDAAPAQSRTIPLGGSPGGPELPAVPKAQANSCNTGYSFSYQYSENGCDTGYHLACSLAEACGDLRDEQLNRGCASQARTQKIAEICKS